jgi:hypothetical protein
MISETRRITLFNKRKNDIREYDCIIQLRDTIM